MRVRAALRAASLAMPVRTRVAAPRRGLGGAVGPLALAGRALGLPGERSLRRRPTALTLQRLRDGAGALARRRPGLALALANLVGALGGLAGALRCLALAGRLEGHARAPGLRKTDGNRLLCGLGTMLAFADVVHLFPNKLARRRGRPLPLAEVFLRALQSLLLWHGYLLGRRDSGSRPKA